MTSTLGKFGRPRGNSSSLYHGLHVCCSGLRVRCALVLAVVVEGIAISALIALAVDVGYAAIAIVVRRRLIRIAAELLLSIVWRRACLHPRRVFAVSKRSFADANQKRRHGIFERWTRIGIANLDVPANAD